MIIFTRLLVGQRCLNFMLLREYCCRIFEVTRAVSVKISSKIKVTGWIRSLRVHKNTSFLHILDGSVVEPLQAVIDNSLLPLDCRRGAYVELHGKLVASPGKEQKLEVLVDDIKVLAPFGYQNESLQPSKTVKFVRRPELQLRSKYDVYNANIHLRSKLTFIIHSIFQEKGYVLIDTPKITASDCEGGGECFQLTSSEIDESLSKHDGCAVNPVHSSSTYQYFGKSAYLSVSSQLHLETMVGTFGKVYCFGGPSFRADHTRSRLHLAEFQMLETEIAPMTSMTELLENISKEIKDIVERTLNECETCLQVIHNAVKCKKTSRNIDKLINNEFCILTYSEALSILQTSTKKFVTQPVIFQSFTKEHEAALVSYCNGIPVFIINFPMQMKPFYMLENKIDGDSHKSSSLHGSKRSLDDDSTCASVDLLLPNVGEIIGGSLRENDYDVLKHRILNNAPGNFESLKWYCNLRKCGLPPHGGWGLGFDRLLLFLTGLPSIKDVVPFPRYNGSLDM